QTGDNADGHVALWITRFLGRSGDRIKPDEGKKDNRGAAHDAGETVRCKWMPVRGIDHECAKRNYKYDDRHLDDNNGGIRARALANSVNQKRGHSSDDEERRQVNSN